MKRRTPYIAASDNINARCVVCGDVARFAVPIGLDDLVTPITSTHLCAIHAAEKKRDGWARLVARFPSVAHVFRSLGWLWREGRFVNADLAALF